VPSWIDLTVASRILSQVTTDKHVVLGLIFLKYISDAFEEHHTRLDAELSDEFLAEVRGMPQRNLAVALLQKLLKGELKKRRRKNVVQARSFAEMLEQTLRRYQNRAIAAAQVIEELIQLAKEMREANARGEMLGLTEDELAFYDALETNDSAVKVLWDDTLRGIARELVETVRNNVTIDWTLRENVRAQLRALVKRILRKHGYPPDKQEKSTQTVLEQAELLSQEWVAA
jgi:type I restriction enzyme, R subunit